jgi:hypothetical protein
MHYFLKFTAAAVFAAVFFSSLVSRADLIGIWKGQGDVVSSSGKHRCEMAVTLDRQEHMLILLRTYACGDFRDQAMQGWNIEGTKLTDSKGKLAGEFSERGLFVEKQSSEKLSFSLSGSGKHLDLGHAIYNSGQVKEAFTAKLERQSP